MQEGGSNYRRRTSFGVPPSLLCEKTGTDLNLYYLASPLNTALAKEISIYLRKPPAESSPPRNEYPVVNSNFERRRTPANLYSSIGSAYTVSRVLAFSLSLSLALSLCLLLLSTTRQTIDLHSAKVSRT